MNINAAGKAAVILIFFSLFSACGELETLLPSTGSYQIKTLVNGSTLESCSIIRSDDKIRPYFTISVVNDPDLIGLLVYFENAQGEVAGEKVRYILKSYAEELAPTEPETEAEVKPDNVNDKVFEEINIEEEKEVKEAEEITQKTEETEKDEIKTGELPEQWAVKEKWSFTDTKPVVKNTDIQITVKSLSEELPYLPLPKTLEIGPYTLVFEAIGLKGTLSRIETSVFYLGSAEFSLKDISIYLSGQSGLQLISPGTTVMLETRLNFDSRLDPYVIWYNGKNIISEGKISGGAGTILWEAPEQAGFYSLRLEIFPIQLRRNNYTGISREITLPVSPKAVNLGYFFENNREHTARSPLAAGTVYPEQVRLITAKKSTEDAKDTNNTKGKTASALPPAGPPAGPPVLPPPPELLRWYQFEGSLRNSTSPSTDAQSLTPVNAKASRWAAAGQSYGLSTGSNDAYSLSPINFFRKENDQGGGIFLFHIVPAVEGVIFSAFFPLQSSSTDGVRMNMVREKNTITLRLRAENTTVEIPINLTVPEPQGFIPVVIEFYIRPYRLEAKLSLNEKYSLENKVGNIRLPGALSGECRIRLGGVMDKSKTETNPTVPSSAQLTPNMTEPSSEEILAALTATTNSAEKDAGITAASETVTQNTIWDEFAILFSTVPLLPEESLKEAAAKQQNAAEIKAAEQKSEKYIPPAVQYETPAAPVTAPTTAAATTAAAPVAAAAADYKSDYKSDHKSETVFESAAAEIPAPDKNETETSPVTSN